MSYGEVVHVTLLVGEEFAEAVQEEFYIDCVVDFLNQHNTDLLACLWIDLYTVISLQKEKGPRAPTRKVVYSETMVKTMIIISDYTLILKEDSGVFC